MTHIPEFLTGIAAVLWPVLAVVVFFRFRTELAQCLAALAGLIGRVRSAEGFGVKIDAGVKIQEAERAVIEKTAVAEEAVLLSPPSPEPVELQSLPKPQILTFEPPILSVDEKRMRVMQLAAELERETKLLALSAGINNINRPTLTLFAEINKQLSFHESVKSPYLAFMQLRNEVAHNWEKALISDELLESGKDLVRLIRSIPRLKIKVVRSAVTLFADPGCTQVVPRFSGVILQNTAGDGVSSSRQIFPTLLSYKQGSNVTWEWDMSNITNLFYYRDPFDGDEPRRGHDSSAAFAGRNIDEII